VEIFISIKYLNNVVSKSISLPDLRAIGLGAVGKRMVGLSVFAPRNVERWTKERLVCHPFLEGIGSVGQKKGWSISLYWKERGALDKRKPGFPVFSGRSGE
jgi:hypothetical protein